MLATTRHFPKNFGRVARVKLERPAKSWSTLISRFITTALSRCECHWRERETEENGKWNGRCILQTSSKAIARGENMEDL